MEQKLHNIKETASHKATAEEMKQNETKYSITIKDNETGDTLVETNTNAVIMAFRDSNNSTEDKSCISQFCVTACDSRTLMGVLEQLDKIQKEIHKTILKELLKEMLDKVGGDNE